MPTMHKLLLGTKAQTHIGGIADALFLGPAASSEPNRREANLPATGLGLPSATDMKF